MEISWPTDHWKAGPRFHLMSSGFLQQPPPLSSNRSNLKTPTYSKFCCWTCYPHITSTTYHPSTSLTSLVTRLQTHRIQTSPADIQISSPIRTSLSSRSPSSICTSSYPPLQLYLSTSPIHHSHKVLWPPLVLIFFTLTLEQLTAQHQSCADWEHFQTSAENLPVYSLILKRYISAVHYYYYY